MIEIDGYVIGIFDSDAPVISYWIEFPGGEGMQVSKEKMIEYLERIKREDF